MYHRQPRRDFVTDVTRMRLIHTSKRSAIEGLQTLPLASCFLCVALSIQVSYVFKELDPFDEGSVHTWKTFFYYFKIHNLILVTFYFIILLINFFFILIYTYFF